MRINRLVSPVFKAAPTSAALKEMEKLCKQGENLLHPDETYTWLDIFQYSMHSNPDFDTGIGKFSSKEALDFAKTMKPYIGFDAQKIYPNGRLTSACDNNFYSPYDRGSLTIGEDSIDYVQLSENNWANILDKETIKKYAKQNDVKGKINYQLEIGNAKSYGNTEILMQAWQNFKKLSDDNFLKKEYENYCKMPIVKNYDRLALWAYVSDKDPDLFLNFDKDTNKQKRFEHYKKLYENEIEFYKFKQFIAYRQTMDAKKKYNNLGIDIIADFAIGNGKEECWAFKDAFDISRSIGYGFPLLRYEDMSDKNSAAYKLFKQEIEFLAQQCDGVRLDVGISYIEYAYSKYSFSYDANNRPDGVASKESKYYKNGNTVTKIIEDTFKEVKGKDFDIRKITYEADSEAGKFLNWDNRPYLNELYRNKGLVLSTQWERPTEIGKGGDWGYGSVDFYTNVANIDPNYIMIGTTNHDCTPIRLVAESPEVERMQEYIINSTPVLEKSLKLSKDYLEYPKNRVRAKLAELQLAPRRYLYYIDAFGKKEAINDVFGKETKEERFKYRIPNNYEAEYNKELQRDNAYNRPEALAIALRAKGFDKTKPTLYKKLRYLGMYLRKEGARTSKQADIIARYRGKDEIMEHLELIG